MRTDATIDKRQVWCPNTSTIAYGKYRAQLGDWVSWNYPNADGSKGVNMIGRMIGRVKYAPALGESPEIKNWIEVLTLTMELTSVHVRWVDPAWVRQVHANAPDIARFLQWFAGEKLPDRTWINGASEYGTLSANQQADQPDWDFAGKLTRYQEYRDRAGKDYQDR